MDCWAQSRDICLTLEEGPGGLSPIDSFIVLLSAGEVVTPSQLRQTLVCKFPLAISGLQNKTNDPAKAGNKVFPRLCPKSQGIFVVVRQKICHYEAWLCWLPCFTSPMPSVARDSPGHLGDLTWPPQVASSPASLHLPLPVCQFTRFSSRAKMQCLPRQGLIRPVPLPLRIATEGTGLVSYPTL